MPSFRQPGTGFTDHFFEVPLDHAAPDGEQITVFAREMVALEHSDRENLPWLLFLQGGPGRSRIRARRAQREQGPGTRPADRHGARDHLTAGTI